MDARLVRFSPWLLGGWLLGCGMAHEADGGAPDSGAPRDADTVLDAAVADSGRDAGTVLDAGDAGGDAGRSPDSGAAECSPGAVRFIPPGQTFAPGASCDDVFACVPDAAAAAAVERASDRFACRAGAEGPCTDYTCSYLMPPEGPRELDASEIAEICAVTNVSPTPDIVCIVYL